MIGATATPYDHLADWPEPDPRLVNGGVRRAPAFPLNALGLMAGFVRDLATVKGGPPDYLAVALITTVAGVVGLARSVQIRPGWIEPCILWGLLIGNPSTGKSQPLDLLRLAVRNIEEGEGSGFSEAESAWKTQAVFAKEVEDAWREKVKRSAKDGSRTPTRPHEADAPPEPQKPRILVGSSTVEKLGKLFAANPRGLTLIIDEGAAWFGNFNKYGGDGDASFYLAAFGGTPITVDRVKEGGSVSADRAYLSSCVGIQPERLSQLLFRGRADDGLVSRFLPAWPDPAPPVWNTRYVDENRIGTVLRRLRSMNPRIDEDGRLSPVVLPLDPDAQSVFAEWWLEAKTKAQSASGLIGGFLGKGLGVVARLALVVELLAWAWNEGAEPVVVSARSLAAAIGLFEDYFAPMAARVYGDAARPAGERGAVALIAQIRERRVRQINAREVRRSWGVPGLATPGEVDEAIKILIDGDCLRDLDEPHKPGRPRLDYAVNPRLMVVAS